MADVNSECYANHRRLGAGSRSGGISPFRGHSLRRRARLTTAAAGSAPVLAASCPARLVARFTHFADTGATETNLMETPEGSALNLAGDTVTATIHPYEILTLRVDYPAR